MRGMLDAVIDMRLTVFVPSALVVAAVALAWTLHLLRLRGRERQLLEMIGRIVGETSEGDPAELARAADRVLVVATAACKEAFVAQFAALDLDLEPDVADSAWAARVACHEAFRAGEPYNLVLLDAALPEAQGPDALSRLGAEAEWRGARLALVRRPPTKTASVARGAVPGAAYQPAFAGVERPGDHDRFEEAIGADENPDRGGRSGFAAAVAADPSALGLRSRRSE